MQVATELRVPVTVMGQQALVYAFVEHGNDLGSSKDVEGNPTEFFKRAGQGSSYGVGINFGMMRAEHYRSQCWHWILLLGFWREVLSDVSHPSIRKLGSHINCEGITEKIS